MGTGGTRQSADRRGAEREAAGRWEAAMGTGGTRQSADRRGAEREAAGRWASRQWRPAVPGSVRTGGVGDGR
jgi:hypothetical protein